MSDKIQTIDINITVPTIVRSVFRNGGVEVGVKLSDGKIANFPTKLQGVDTARQAGLDPETTAELVAAVNGLAGIPQAILFVEAGIEGVGRGCRLQAQGKTVPRGVCGKQARQRFRLPVA